MLGLRLGLLGMVGRSVAAWNPAPHLFGNSEKGGLWDFTTLASLYQDSAFTTPCAAVGDPIGGVLDTSGNGAHLTQATSTKRFTLGRMPATGVQNLLVNTATLSTQNVTTTAQNYTIQFTGAGSVTASGTYVGALTNGQTFACTAGTLTLTVAGSVTAAQLEAGSTATAKQVVGAVYDVTEAGVASVWAGYADGVDDCLVSPSIDFSGTDKMTVWAGVRKLNTVLDYIVSNRGGATWFGLLGDTGAGQYQSIASSLTTSVSAFVAAVAPSSDIVTAMSNFAVYSNLIRRNGVQAHLVTGPPAVGNYSNKPVFVGQREATSSPFKGFISAICVRGATTTPVDIIDMENWLEAKTPGVTLP